VEKQDEHAAKAATRRASNRRFHASRAGETAPSAWGRQRALPLLRRRWRMVTGHAAPQQQLQAQPDQMHDRFGAKVGL
jgi:hypothetical protein